MKMILNEYRLLPFQKQAQQLVATHMEEFFFSTDAALPPGPREWLRLRPSMKCTALDKGSVIFLVPERPMQGSCGVARGTSARGLREKKDRV